MSPNNQHKIESLSTSEVNHPSPTIVTLFKDDSNINDKIRTTATTEITTDEEEESSTEKQHTTTTSSANSSMMTGTPAAASPQTPSNRIDDDNTSTKIRYLGFWIPLIVFRSSNRIFHDHQMLTRKLSRYELEPCEPFSKRDCSWVYDWVCSSGEA